MNTKKYKYKYEYKYNINQLYKQLETYNNETCGFKIQMLETYLNKKEIITKAIPHISVLNGGTARLSLITFIEYLIIS